MSSSSHSLATLITLLRDAGYDPGVEELADAVWLARWARPVQDSRPVPGPPPTGLAAQQTPGHQQVPTQMASGEQPPQASDDLRRLYPVSAPRGVQAPGEGGDGAAEGVTSPVATASRVRVPSASALPDLLELQRAMRPLQRFRPPVPPVQQMLNHVATAERSANVGLVTPVFQPKQRRETSMQLLMDASSSMVVWQQLLEEMRQVCEQLGAFRDVQVHYLHRADDGTVMVGADRDPAGRLREPDQLLDPTGRQLTLVISDCVGPLWRDGQAHRLLHRWGCYAPVAVIQPLPQRMWPRTGLPAEPGLLLRREGPGARIDFQVDQRRGRRVKVAAPPTGSVPVPVLPPHKAALGSWSALLSGSAAASVRGAVAWVQAHQPAFHPPAEAAPQSAEERVRAFFAVASPAARRLIGFLAAAPLNLPVMQLVQRTMLADTGPTELAEVLLSGLISRTGPPSPLETDQWYEFAEGVQDLLLRSLPRGDAALVLKHVSSYVERHFGHGARNFPALARAYLTGGQEFAAGSDIGLGRPSTARIPQPFAEVAGRVVRRYLHSGPAPVPTPPQTALQLIARFWETGQAHYVFDAVDLLRQGPDHTRAQLAEALLLLWELQGDPAHLREAKSKAEQAVALAKRAGQSSDDAEPLAPSTREERDRGRLRAHATCGRVLHQCAFERLEAGQREAAVACLHEAESQFHEARWLSIQLLDRRFQTVTDLAAVQYELWRLTGQEGALHEASWALQTSFESAWSERVEGVARPHLLYGRILLAQAEHRLRATTDHTDRRDLARIAVEQLRRGVTLLPRPSPRAAGPDQQPAGDDLIGTSTVDPAPAGSAPEDNPDAPVEPTTERTRRDFTTGSPVSMGNVADMVHRWETHTESVCLALLDLAAALRIAEEDADAVTATLEEALGSAGLDSELRARCLVAMGRDRVQRAISAQAPEQELDRASVTFARAARLLLRGTDEYNDVLTQWSEVLLRRAEGTDPPSEAAALRAVQVARDCVRETSERSARLAGRLLLLGRAVFLRYQHQDDLTDLYEAEDVLARAARSATDPLEEAEAWLEHGDVHRALHTRTGSPARLDRAAESYRRAWHVVHSMESPSPAALLLAGRAQHRRGEVFEAAVGPRSALEAYRAALDVWRQTPDEGGAEGAVTRERIRGLTN